MSSKTAVNFKNYANVTILSFIIVCATLAGCAADGTQNPFASLAPAGTSIEQARKELDERGPNTTIQQAAFESTVQDPQWRNSLTVAIEEAQANDKLILANFTGSDWCHFCVKLKDEVFNTPEFKSWASDNVVLLEIDSPKRTQLPLAVRQHNEMLKSRFKITAFPTVLMLDADGNVLAKMGYERGKSASQWVQIAESRLQQASSQSRTAVANGQGSGTRLH